MRVIIVDDYPDTAETTGVLLATAGHECRTATCGADALVAAEGFHPELAIIDIGLPAMDGYALLGVLRSRFAARPPFLVATTGWKHLIKQAVEAGFDQCILKPAGREQFLRAVRLAQQRHVA
ncbi:MAG TPA: response regulator [Kofleriaceae bacterium]|nr:response regulator [Kofleriaceae bacterium]